MSATAPKLVSGLMNSSTSPVPLRRRRRRLDVRGASWGSYTFLIIVGLVTLFPLYWSFLIGSGDATTLFDPNKSWLPGGNFFANAATVIANPSVKFWQALANSVIVSTTVSVSVVFFAALAGFAFARLRFRGRDALLVFVIATTAVPTQLSVVPLFILMAEFGWIGNLAAVIVPTLVTAFGVFWMTQYVRNVVPEELIESARIDGASSFRTFRLIVLPIIRPAAGMLGLFTFIATWTNFFWPFIVLGPANPTLPVALAVLQANYFVDYSLVLAGAFIATVPLLLVFAIAGKQLVSGIMQGAVKG